MTVIKDGEITWPPPAPKLSAAPAAKPAAAPVMEPAVVEKPAPWKTALGLGVAGLLLLGVGSVAPAAFLAHFTVFVLACILGYMVIWNVTPALHTPLMSVTNAISGIIVIGALLQVSGDSGMVTLLAGIAILIATINIAGGFLVTQRMLKMFQK